MTRKSQLFIAAALSGTMAFSVTPAQAQTQTPGFDGCWYQLPGGKVGKLPDELIPGNPLDGTLQERPISGSGFDFQGAFGVGPGDRCPTEANPAQLNVHELTDPQVPDRVKNQMNPQPANDTTNPSGSSDSGSSNSGSGNGTNGSGNSGSSNSGSGNNSSSSSENGDLKLPKINGGALLLAGIPLAIAGAGALAAAAPKPAPAPVPAPLAAPAPAPAPAPAAAPLAAAPKEEKKAEEKADTSKSLPAKELMAESKKADVAKTAATPKRGMLAKTGESATSQALFAVVLLSLLGAGAYIARRRMSA